MGRNAKILIVTIITTLSLLIGCEAGAAIYTFKISKPPNSLVYQIGEENIDLSGMMIDLINLEEQIAYTESIENYILKQYEPGVRPEVEIVYIEDQFVNYHKPGIYKVNLYWLNTRIPADTFFIRIEG
ncbi:MAG: hypothetical protein IKR03_02235 [Clostridia bacterium]|nr:hypothetical protein [Christensenellaceae bacterium]MBR6239578.1 hypothetical protein [Clostridia bacterium]